MDLGFDNLGRPDLRIATRPTPVTFELTGLAPTASQDLVEITSSNASIWERLAPQGTLAAGSTIVALDLRLGRSTEPAPQRPLR